MLSLRQPASAVGKPTDKDVVPLPATPVLPERLSSTTWRAADAAAAIPEQRGESFYGRPFKLSILMAAYNEEKTITRVVEEILKVNCPCEIELIIVDDGSTDATPRLLSHIDDSRVVVLRHPVNRGKGAALITAVGLATGTYIVPFDADLEYEPDDIPRMLEPVLKGRCQVVYGVRLFGFNTVYQSYMYAKGNRFLTFIANLIFNANLTDLHTCLKLMPLATLKSLDLREKGFGIDTEITARLLSRGIRPFDVPVSYYGRTHADGKKIRWHDAIACARILVRTRLRGSGRVRERSVATDDEMSVRASKVGP